MKIVLVCFAFLTAFLLVEQSRPPVHAANPAPCGNVTNTATAGQVLSANNSGRTPPCSWVNNGTKTAAPLHSITFVITGASGGAITTGALEVFPPLKLLSPCTINEVDVTGTPSTGHLSGSITVDIWKTNAAIPTSGNKISASDPATLASAVYSADTTLTGWTKSVVTGDVFGGTIASAATVRAVTVVIWCQ